MTHILLSPISASRMQDDLTSLKEAIKEFGCDYISSIVDGEETIYATGHLPLLRNMASECSLQGTMISLKD